MGTIAQALATALQLTVTETTDATPQDLGGFFSQAPQTTVTQSPYDQARTIEESIQEQLDAADPDVRSALNWRLSNIASNLTYDVDAERDAETVQNTLPQINDMIASLDDGATIVVEGDTYSNIHQLQSALGIESDGEFGPQTARTLLEHLATSEQYASLDDLQDLRTALKNLAPDEFGHFNTLVDHAAEIAENAADHAAELADRDAVIAEQNQFIAGTFEECVGRDVIDLNQEDPFGDIIQHITDAYADDEDEISIASGHVAAAIKNTCGDTLRLLPEAMQVSVVTSLAKQLQQPLENAVRANIQNARDLHESTIAGNALVLGQRNTEDPSPRIAPIIGSGPS